SQMSTKNVDIRSLLQELKIAALQIPNDFQREHLLDQIGAMQALSGDISGAIEALGRTVFDNAKQSVCSTLLILMARFGFSTRRICFLQFVLRRVGAAQPEAQSGDPLNLL